MVIYINGQAYDASPNQTILQVARGNDIYIPSLCYHEKVGAAGKCRVCVVEVEGARGLVTSCNTLCRDGMVVNTNSPSVKAAQKVVVDLILSSGIHDCLSCEQTGQCELQDVCYYLGIERPSYDMGTVEIDNDDSSEFIFVERSKCISCGRCVAGCNHTVVNEVLEFGQRGYQTKIVFDNNLPMGTSACVQCGECVQLCPVGAIIDKKSRGKGRPWQLEKIETVCPYCGVGCKVHLHVDKRTNTLVRVTGVEGSPANNGMLCVKGRYGYDFVNDPNRLRTPLIKEEGKFREASWEEAITLVANKFMEIKKEHGADSIGGLCSAKVTNEDNYVFMKFMRKEIGTNNVDHCARLCHSSTVAGLAATLGSGAMTNDIAGIHKADVIMIFGSDTSAAHPVISARIKQAVRHGKTKLIVVDPKRIVMSNYADIYAPIRPGTNVAVLNCLMQIIIKNDWHDKEFIENRTEDFDLLKEEVMKDKYSPEEVEKISNIPAKTLYDIAEMFGKAETASFFYAMGITQHSTGTENVMSVSNLQLLCGNLGKDGGGVNPLRGQSNVQGACDMGGLPNVYSGYQAVTNPQVREKFEKAWDCKLPDKVGLTLTDMMNEVDTGKIKCLYIMGENPVISDPDQNHIIHSLENLDFLVVQDIFMTETTEYADVILPATSYAEKSGHITNTERRVQRLNFALKAPGQARQDWEIIQMIASKMGGNWNYRSYQDIWAEVNETTPSYAGILWDRVGTTGIHWPCPTPEHPGTPVLHKGQFSRGLGLFKAIEYKYPKEMPDEEYPLILTTGRVLAQYHTGTMTRKTKGLNNIAKPMMMISVQDAEKLNITNSEKVKVSSRRGEIEIDAFVTKRIHPGVVYIPFHYHEAPANRLTIAALDPIAKIPEFKVCAVKVEKL
ncbi:MAG: formate dehydrogenase subunit alpha [Candidatus Cloacimonadales bacterium]|jgi:formate dehydrogenase alpha subunit|nr:formate dehydrogenase subunit alpha [Candidatus Cloacimonadota bacterium]MDX9978010.1 formate dehydrogenase subunit alpha [Candidatus Cloacimonadales bacterium]